jgi:hypothetical protein
LGENAPINALLSEAEWWIVGNHARGGSKQYAEGSIRAFLIRCDASPELV